MPAAEVYATLDTPEGVDRAFAKISGSDHFRSCTRNHGAWFQNGLVVAQHLCVADPRIYHCHLRAFVAEDAHDGVKLCTAFCEFGSERVAESVRLSTRMFDGHLALPPFPFPIHQP